jgi:hypothetical protein
MKRSLLDITQKMFRKPGNAVLTPKDLNNDTYWIFEAAGWKFVEVLREIEYRTEQDRIRLYINTQNVSAKDYIVETGEDGLIFKFIKSRFEFNLDSGDFIEVKGDIEKYA